MQSTHNTPNTLNERCAMAARLAWVLAPIAAMFEVMVVPMFSPSTRAIPIYIGSTPLEQSTMVMAMRAADDCMQNVSIVPNPRNANMVR